MATLHVQRPAILDIGSGTEQPDTYAEYVKRLENARAEGYAAGQRAMRERAARAINSNLDASGSRYIEALPIMKEPNS